MREYLDAAGISSQDDKLPLFRAADGKRKQLTAAKLRAHPLESPIKREPFTDSETDRYLAAWEVTGERIRDKCAASKRKGIWMGAYPNNGHRIGPKPTLE